MRARLLRYLRQRSGIGSESGLKGSLLKPLSFIKQVESFNERQMLEMYQYLLAHAPTFQVLMIILILSSYSEGTIELPNLVR